MAEVLNLCSPGPGNVNFSLNGTTYQNNSIVSLEDIGEGGDALLCVTDQIACCRHTDNGNGSVIGNWFFPNGTRVPSINMQWGFRRTRGQSVVRLQRIKGGEDGIYHCEIPAAFDIIQMVYIGVYTASTGEWYMDTSMPE